MSSTYGDLTRSVESTRDRLDLLVRLINGDNEVIIAEARDALDDWDDAWLVDVDTDDVDFDRDAASEAAREELDQWPLEAYLTGRRDIGARDWDVIGVVVVFGTGGPHIAYTSEGGGYVVGYWGGDTVRRAVSSDVVEYFDAWCEEY